MGDRDAEEAREDDGDVRREDEGVEKGDAVGDVAVEQGEEERGRFAAKEASAEFILGVTSSVGRTARRSASLDGDINKTLRFLCDKQKKTLLI